MAFRSSRRPDKTGIRSDDRSARVLAKLGKRWGFLIVCLVLTMASLLFFEGFAPGGP